MAEMGLGVERPLNKEKRGWIARLKKDGAWDAILADLEADLVDVHSLAALGHLRKQYLDKADADNWTATWKSALLDRIESYEAEITKSNLLNEISAITTLGGLQSFWEENWPTIKAFGKKDAEEFTAMKDKMKSDMMDRSSTLAAG